jgi:flagellar hook-length control protein FliK
LRGLDQVDFLALLKGAAPDLILPPTAPSFPSPIVPEQTTRLKIKQFAEPPSVPPALPVMPEAAPKAMDMSPSAGRDNALPTASASELPALPSNVATPTVIPTAATPMPVSPSASDGSTELPRAILHTALKTDVPPNPSASSEAQAPPESVALPTELPPTSTTAAVPAKPKASGENAGPSVPMPAPSKSIAADPAIASPSRHEPAHAPPLAEQVHEAVRDHLDQVQQQGRVEVRMELHPPELGKMQLHVTMDDNRVNVRMIVQDDNTKRLMDQQLEPLRVRFADMGVSLGQLDVRRDGAGPQEQPADTETSAPSAQSGSSAANRPRNSYASAADSTRLVDVIA